MKVLLSREAQREIAELPKVIRARLYEVLGRLQRWPEVSGAKPLRGELSGCYRMRTGDWRVVYEIRDNVSLVLVVAVGHRREIYRAL